VSILKRASHSAALGPDTKRQLAVRESLLGWDYCETSATGRSQ
jgi:hypothetical protein